MRLAVATDWLNPHLQQLFDQARAASTGTPVSNPTPVTSSTPVGAQPSA
jgi:hypothetical protein